MRSPANAVGSSSPPTDETKEVSLAHVQEDLAEEQAAA